MYKNFDIDALISKGETKVYTDDRSKYDFIFEHAEEYINKNDLIINVICENVQTIYEIFSKDILKDATKLANLIFKKSNVPQYNNIGLCTKVITKLPDRIMELFVNERKMFVFYKIPTKIDSRSFPGKFTKLILNYIPSELNLISVCSKLMNPDNFTEWAELEVVERYWVNNLEDNYKKNTNKKSAEKLDIIRNDINKKLVLNYVSKYGIAVISNNGRLQVVTENSFDVETERITNLLKEFNVETSFSINEPFLPTDFKIKKMSGYYYNIKWKRYDAFIDIYNNGNFSIIPYIEKNGIKFCSPYAIIYFKSIDLWIYKTLYTLDKISLRCFEERYGEILGYIKMVKTLDFSETFPKTYIGKYIDPIVYSKRMLKKIKDKTFPAYYPGKITIS
jgi:hypothetical protein